MTEETLFLGKPYVYWIELQGRVEQLGIDHLLSDLARMHAKVSYYEQMLDRINAYRESIK